MPVKTVIAKKNTTKKAGKKSKSALNSLLSFDHTVRNSYKDAAGHVTIIGVDEVGIGCLAGPVVAAAIVLPLIETKSKFAKSLAKLNDSKKVDKDTRIELAQTLRGNTSFGIGSASVEEIDQYNILQARFIAMKRAVIQLIAQIETVSEMLLLVDGNKKIPECNYEQMCIIQGDSQSASIAAASIIAKVFRDQLMEELSQGYPEYLWHQNKGYGSAAHRQAMTKHGLTVHHRRSFNSSAYELDEDEE